MTVLTVRHKYIKRDAHDDGSVICDIVGIVGISLLVPFLKSASVYLAVAVFRRNKTRKLPQKFGMDLELWNEKSIFAYTKSCLKL